MACTQKPEDHRVVLCIPVYGQSLALGEEAERITDFDLLASINDGRIVTENLDHAFGYFDNDNLKQMGKKLVHYHKRAYELSVYGMAEVLTAEFGTDTLICTFPGGQGATPLARLSKGTAPYHKFMSDIAHAYEEAAANGWTFKVPAVCYMQGESDIEDYPDTDYKQLLRQLCTDLNQDIKSITGQHESIRIICYQSNNVSGGRHYHQDAYQCTESAVPQSQMELIRDDSLFWVSGPTYPYTFVRERIHIDGTSQKRIGHLAALSVIDIIRGGNRRQGLIPSDVYARGSEVVVRYHVPVSPLQIDTTAVAKAKHYGFGVISPKGIDILQQVIVAGDSVRLLCSQSADSCRVRYAINGELQKSGNRIGPRGNLRDSQGDSQKATIQGKEYPLHNWSYQFDIALSVQ